MAFIFDNLLATLVTMTVLMLLLSTQFRSTQAGIEQVSAHAAKTKALTLGTWLEDDISSLGANFGRNRMRFSAPHTLDDGNTGEWVFYSDSLGDGGAVTRHATRYILREVDEIERQDGSGMQPLYQLTREVAASPVVNDVMTPISPSAWQMDGMSVATLSTFRIDLIDRNGEATVDPVTADFIRVEFAMVPEFERGQSYLRELYWTTTLRVRPFWSQPPPAQEA